MSSGVEVFGPLAEDYARYRPGYPAEVLGTLTRACGLTRDWMIADIGSGTGNLARLFLGDGYQVVGVEPNPEMREAGERLLAGYAGFGSLDGTAESIPLEARSVDLIAVGQALHWFDVDRARAEFRRILRTGGWIAVAWNDRHPEVSAFAQEYAALARACADARPSACTTAPLLSTGLDYLFRDAVPISADFPHMQQFDLDGFLGRARSSGFIPQPGAPGHSEITALMTDLFARHQHEGAVEFHYITRLYFGRLDEP